jgi:E3 ubiquitin-protein ligase UBR3
LEQGKFSLRDECWKELDLYHPRWNANELQSAEDRYFRSCKASALIKQLPKWKKSLSPFQDLSRIATCGRVHDILRSILFHAVFSEKMSESRAPEGVLITALHLLALGLDTCSLFSYDKSFDSRHSDVQSDSVMEPSAYEPPPLLSKATEKVQFGGIDSDGISNKQSLISLLVLLMKKYSPEALCVPRESHQCNVGVLIQGLLKTFADLHHGCMHEVESLAPQVLHRMLYAQDSLLEGQTSNVSEAERRKLLARERQAAIMVF